MNLLHSADWQLGKPFGTVDDVQKRSLIQQERINALSRLAEAARNHKAECVIVAGDLFDSSSATKSTVSAACSAIGAMQIPVFAIPGNHDHGGPGGLWDQPFFQRECAHFAPNFKILLASEPIELETAVLLPCPLLRRHESNDPTAWLRSIEPALQRFGQKPRVVLAHGSVQGFGTQADDDEGDQFVPNQIDLSRLPESTFDYIALGDWHGTKQVGPKAWYSGTPEPDRFPKGADHDAGNVLAVTVQRGASPQVQAIPTARFVWHQIQFNFADDAGLNQLADRITAAIAARAGQDLLYLELTGSLGIEATTQLEQKLDSWSARLLRLKILNKTVVAPSSQEIDALTRRASDPLIARIAAKLVARTLGDAEEAAVARIALRELHAACVQK